MHFTIRVMEACPDLGLHPGDLVTFEPELPDCALYVHRPLRANAATILPMLESGAAELVTPHSTLSDFAEAAGWTGPRLVVEKASPPVPLDPIDLDAALAALAEPEVGASEPCAADLLRCDSHGQARPGGWDAIERLARARDRIRRKTPRPCRVCGTEFIPRQLKTITCDACKAAGQQRCRGCGELFTAATLRARRCSRCAEAGTRA